MARFRQRSRRSFRSFSRSFSPRSMRRSLERNFYPRTWHGDKSTRSVRLFGLKPITFLIIAAIAYFTIGGFRSFINKMIGKK